MLYQPFNVLLLPLGVLDVSAVGLHRELFTTNAICKQQYCINPVFPGVEDLGRLEASRWQCSAKHKVTPHMRFCQGAVDYSPSLPILAANPKTDIATLVRMQEKAAVTAYAYHLSGMGKEAWDHTNPKGGDDCTQSIWRLVCFTYFPANERGCKEGQEVKYLRPCRSSCGNYIRSCGVECCDESVQCTFMHERPLNNTHSIKTSGYSQMMGPSPFCTGSAWRQSSLSRWLALLVLFVLQVQHGLPRPSSKSIFLGVLLTSTLVMQGCDLDQQIEVPSHHIGNWHKEPDYLIKYEFIPPGTSIRNARLNSCSVALAPTLQCSGRGVCKAWDPDFPSNMQGQSMTFCECNQYWADPECRTPRKSQTYAYLYSLFLGFLGADQFYLGYPLYGIIKLLSLGGLGVWWLFDVVRIGSAPVMTYTSFRLAGDLPHWVFVLSLVTFFLLLGFVGAGLITLQHRWQRRKDGMLMQTEEEARRWSEVHIPPRPKGFASSSGPGRFYGGKFYGSDDSHLKSLTPDLVPNWYGRLGKV